MTLDKSAAFFTDTQRKLQAAKNTTELEAIARAMDTPEFDRLPAHCREDLGVLYSHRYLVMTGALVP